MNLLLVGIAALVACFAYGIIAGQRILRNHRGVSRDEFIGAFAGTGIPPEIPGAVYGFYKSRVLAKDFSVAPDDDYEKALCEGEEEIDDDARFLMKKLGLKLPPAELRLQWAEQMMNARLEPPLKLGTDSVRWRQPIQTLRDMVLWLDWVRQHQEPNA